MEYKIVCPYCKSHRLQIIGGNLKEGYKCWKTSVVYQCLDNLEHKFETIKYNEFNVDK